MRTARVNLSIDPDLKYLAQLKGLNLSEVLDGRLREMMDVTPREAEKKVLVLKKEILLTELEEIDNKIKKKGGASVEVSEWDRNHFETEIKRVEGLTKQEFMEVSEWKCKVINKVLNKKLTYQQYLGKFTKHIKDYKEGVGKDEN